jgi:hypothetical protein
LAALGGIGLAVWAGLTPHDNIGAILGFLFVLIAVFGLFCGILTRAATLWLAPLRRRPVRFVLIAIVGYFLAPFLSAGPSTTLAWLKQPLLSTCRASTHAIGVAGKTLHVPGAPAFSVHALRSTQISDRGGTYSFASDRSFRRLCRRTSHEGFVGPAILSFDAPGFADSPGRAWAEANCPSARHDAMVRVCKLAESGRLNGGLDSATIYGEDSFEEVSRQDRSAEGKTISAWIAAGRPMEMASAEQDGIFTTQADTLQVSRAEGLAGPAGETLCHLRG